MKREKGLSKKQTSILFVDKGKSDLELFELKAKILAFIFLLTSTYILLFNVINTSIKNFFYLFSNNNLFVNYEFIFNINKNFKDISFICLSFLIVLFIPLLLYIFIFRPNKLSIIAKGFFYLIFLVTIVFSVIGFINPSIININSQVEFIFGFFPILFSIFSYHLLIIYLGIKKESLYEEKKYLLSRNIVRILIVMYFLNILLSITNNIFFLKEPESPYFYIFNSFLLILYIYIFYNDEYEWLYELSSYIFQNKYINEIENIRSIYIKIISGIDNNFEFSDIEKELRKKAVIIEYEEKISSLFKKQEE